MVKHTQRVKDCQACQVLWLEPPEPCPRNDFLSAWKRGWTKWFAARARESRLELVK